jgi:hypothetical protein
MGRLAGQQAAEAAAPLPNELLGLMMARRPPWLMLQTCTYDAQALATRSPSPATACRREGQAQGAAGRRHGQHGGWWVEAQDGRAARGGVATGLPDAEVCIPTYVRLCVPGPCTRPWQVPVGRLAPRRSAAERRAALFAAA